MGCVSLLIWILARIESAVDAEGSREDHESHDHDHDHDHHHHHDHEHEHEHKHGNSYFSE